MFRITSLKIIEMSRKKGVISWTKNWSGRGVEMMDRMERFSDPLRRPKIVNVISFTKKLDALINAYPYCKFYRSLKNQVRCKYPLSAKQLQAIDNGYKRFTEKQTSYQPAI
jgi:hypothetical protein